MITFTVKIKPMGAVRTTQHSKYTEEAYQRYMTYKRLIAIEARKNIKNPLQGAVIIHIDSYHAIPKATSKVKREKIRVGTLRPTVKPDVDNIVKGVMDSLNKIAWKDDNQVVDQSASKYYSDEPRIEIRIEEVEVA